MKKHIKLNAPGFCVTSGASRSEFAVAGGQLIGSMDSRSGEKLEIVRYSSKPFDLYVRGEKANGRIDLSLVIHEAISHVLRENFPATESAPVAPQDAAGRLFAKAREAMALRAKYGHSDVGSVLMLWVKGDLDEYEALNQLQDLIIDYKRDEEGTQ